MYLSLLLVAYACPVVLILEQTLGRAMVTIYSIQVPPPRPLAVVIVVVVPQELKSWIMATKVLNVSASCLSVGAG